MTDYAKNVENLHTEVSTGQANAEHGLQTEFQHHLATVAKDIGESRQTVGFAARATREALGDVGIDIPRSDSAGIKDIPKTVEIARDSQLQPGDVVIVGATPANRFGNSFIVTPEMRAASDHVASIPALDKLPEVHIYRPTER